jgi:indolepyruvate ferredoxin oxidoreductase alpha subunit
MSTGSTLDEIILGTGISEDHFRVIEPIPRNHERNVEVFKEELEFDGPSVIIARRACIEAQKRKAI